MMRGDIKWPPEGTRQQMVNEEEEQKKIAEGPKFRPKKVHKVSNFFFFSKTEQPHIHLI
ncbi:hypothetical protein ACKWTF_003371 [Chironomus riparius]